jgi:F-type H+/Na+-transporting ATPase subunit alpha
VARAEQELLRFIREEKSEIRNAILSSKELSADTEEKLKAALEEFRRRFKVEGDTPTVKAAVATK